MKSAQLKLYNGLIATAVLAIGIIVGAVLLMSGVEIDRDEDARVAQVVTAVEAQTVTASPLIEASGTVVPARKLTVQPQVSGRVTRRHPGLVTGGVVQEGEELRAGMGAADRAAEVGGTQQGGASVPICQSAVRV